MARRLVALPAMIIQLGTVTLDLRFAIMIKSVGLFVAAVLIVAMLTAVRAYRR